VAVLTVNAGLLVLTAGVGAALLVGGIFHNTTPSNAAEAAPTFTQRFLFELEPSTGIYIPLKTIKTAINRAAKHRVIISDDV
jgi:hypothetical protein